MKSRYAAVAVLLACSGAALGQTNWNNTLGGDWSVPGNWTPNDIPNSSTESAVLGNLGSPYVVQFDITASILGCSLHSSATLNVEPGRLLGINAGGIANNGVIVINDAGTFADAWIRSDAAFAITGSGRIELNSLTSDFNDARIEANSLFPITIGASHLVHGSGVMRGPILLNGTVDADRDGRDLQLVETHDLSGGGVIRGTNNGRVVIIGAVTGGTVDGGVEAAGSVASLGDATTTGDNGVRPGSILTLTGLGILNSGNWLVNTAGIFSNAVVRAGDNVTIAGAGSIELNSMTADLDDARLEGQPGSTLTIGGSQTVNGSGRVNGPIVLRGTIDADRAGRDLLVYGDVDASGGGMLIGSGGTISLQATYTGGSIAGGVEAEGIVPSVNGTTASGSNGVRPGSTLSILGGGLTNDGTITVNTAGIFSNARIRATENATIDGTGNIDLNSVTADPFDAALETAEGIVLTIDSSQAVTGSGVAAGSFVLDGGINADRDTRDILVSGSFDMSAGGLMQGSNGGKVSMRAAATGGTFAGGVEAETLAGSVDGVHMTGNNGIRQTSTLSVLGGGFSNDGLLTVNTTGSFSDAILHFAESCSIGGAGTIDFNSTTSDLYDAYIRMAEGVVVHVAEGQSLTGSGVIEGSISLTNGSINANRDLRDLRVEADVDMTGGGSMIGTNGGKVAARRANVNGEWLGGVEAETSSPSVNGVVMSGTNGIRPTSTLAIAGDGFTNNGTLVINTTAHFSDALLSATGVQTIEGLGVLHLNSETGDHYDASIRTAIGGELTVGEDQVIIGRGAIDGLIHLPCGIAPGDDANPTDYLYLVGTIDLTSTTTVTMGIAGSPTADYDQLLGNAALQLDGTLVLELLDGFTPAFEQRFTIIDVGSLTGQFASVISPVDGLGIFRVVQTADKIEAVWTCQSDLNGDGNLDFFDVQFFLNAFSSEALYGDYNEDGANNFFDIQAFLNDFAAGCL